MDRKCYLKCIEDSHEPILLTHNREVTIGRSPTTKIKITRCSRKQVSFVANTRQMEVTVTHLGENPSAANGQLLRKNDTVTLYHGDSIELVHGVLKHNVIFEPPPSPDFKKKQPAPEQSNGEPKLKRQRLDNQTKASSSYSIFESSSSGVKKQSALDQQNNGEPSAIKTQCLDNQTEASSSSLVIAVQSNKWETVNNGELLVFTSKGTEHSSKIASYDLDWTIVGTSSGRVYPKDKADWCILLPEIPKHLKKLRSEGFKLVIFSNQHGIGTGRVKVADFKSKIESVIARLNVPFQVFVATGSNLYRKPVTGMWEALVEEYNGGISIDVSSSHYCGDAAGRPANWAPRKKKDFSCSDRLFAMNIGIKFFTPEEHFQNARAAPFVLPDFKPMSLPTDIPECHPPTAKLVVEDQELAILVGCPGSGKSFVATKKLVAAGYKYVNMDELKSASRCVEAVKSGLQSGLRVVVDNTNPDRQSRARFLKAAQQMGVKCRCLVMATSAIHARHNNKFRELTDPSHSIIPEMIIRTYEKNYQEPNLDEGFSEIVKVNFIPQFSDAKLKSLYGKYLI